MLLISDETLDLIAGGTASGEASRGSIPIVTITGYLPPEGSGGGGGGGWNWGGGGEGSGSTPQPPAEPPKDCTKIHTSPPPELVPAGVELNQLRNTMVDLAALMKGFADNREHGVLVVSDANGFLRVGDFAHGNNTTVDASITVQPGEKIVAWLHTHPTTFGVDQRYPSSPASNAGDGDSVDTLQWRRLMANPHADPGMLMYILDNSSGKVWEYPGKGPDERPLGNNVSDDTPATCR